MNTARAVDGNMQYIQQVFLRVQDHLRDHPYEDLKDLIRMLDAESPRFRSVAYEGASMEIGLSGLSGSDGLGKWEAFYKLVGKVHSFHVDIGLGWAFAKNGSVPRSEWEGYHPLMRWMVFDGIGYYHGLFKGRNTIKKLLVPKDINEIDQKGFDQGLGRRLWYHSQGDGGRAAELIQSFPSSRHPDLWRGLGIACGYVGGLGKSDLDLLVEYSGDYRQNIQTGVALAAFSRIASESLNPDIEMACVVICGKNITEIEDIKENVIRKLDYASGSKAEMHSGVFLFQLESSFS